MRSRRCSAGLQNSRGNKLAVCCIHHITKSELSDRREALLALYP